LAASAGAASVANTPSAAMAPEQISNANSFLKVILLEPRSE
jgi:hypothetical protein